jgi:hypothetical protein
MAKGITTLPKRKMFPASVLLPSESEIYSTLLEANLSQGPKGRQRSNPEHTQQALFAEKLRRDNFKKPQFHPHPTAHREGIAAHQELRNLRSVTDKLEDMLKGLSTAPQIRHRFLKHRNREMMLRNRRFALARSAYAPTEVQSIAGDNPFSPIFSEMEEVPGPRRSVASKLDPARTADRREAAIVVGSAQQQARLLAASAKAAPSIGIPSKAGPSKAPSKGPPPRESH